MNIKELINFDQIRDMLGQSTSYLLAKKLMPETTRENQVSLGVVRTFCKVLKKKIEPQEGKEPDFGAIREALGELAYPLSSQLMPETTMPEGVNIKAVQSFSHKLMGNVDTRHTAISKEEGDDIKKKLYAAVEPTVVETAPPVTLPKNLEYVISPAKYRAKKLTLTPDEFNVKVNMQKLVKEEQMSKVGGTFKFVGSKDKVKYFEQTNQEVPEAK